MAAWQAEWRAGFGAVADPRVAERWEAAHARATDRHVYHRWPVIRAWIDTIGAAGELLPVIGRFEQADAIIHLAGVVATYGGRVVSRRVLELAGQDLFGYHDPLVARGGGIDWDGFWSAVRDSSREYADQALFRCVRADRAGVRFAEPAGVESPVLDLRDFADLTRLLARCSPNHRGEVHRRVRRLREQGEVSLWVASPHDVPRAHEDFARHAWPAWIERSTAQGSALHQRPGLRAYCDLLLTDGLREGWTHYAVLQLDGEPVAWHLGLQDERRLYWWLPIHKPQLSAFSPGKVLLTLLIEWLLANRWHELHFQTGSQPYKLAWRPRCPALRSIRWHAATMKGQLLSQYDRAMQIGG